MGNIVNNIVLRDFLPRENVSNKQETEKQGQVLSYVIQ